MVLVVVVVVARLEELPVLEEQEELPVLGE